MTRCPCPASAASALLTMFMGSFFPVFQAEATDGTGTAALPFPNPLICQDGSAVKDPEAWTGKRRPELLRLFESEIYGRTLLGRPANLKFSVREELPSTRGGRATRLRVGVLFEGREDGRQMELLVFLPNDVPGPVPILLGLNFDGNHTVIEDPDLPLPKHWALGLFSNRLENHRPTEAGRGAHRHQWQIDYVLEQGLGVATAAYGEIEPDEPGRWKEGVRGLAAEPGSGDWGSIGAWAWGLSRAMDYLETNPRIDARRVGLIGFSRLGKTALWAAAQDERFALVISNGSGAGGAALSRHLAGETVADLTKRFPHWFAGRFAHYADNEAALPVDQHELLALTAPRALLVTSAEADPWSDPEGEFLSVTAAAPVFELLGAKVALPAQRPPCGKPLTGRLGYFIREGGHDVLLEDWKVMVPFADRHLPMPTPSPYSMDRYAGRLAALSAAERDLWKDWLERSDDWRRRNDAALADEVKTAGLAAPRIAPEGRDFKCDNRLPAEWFRSEEAKRLQAAVLSYQLPSGGWSKAVDYAAGPRPAGTQWTSQSRPSRYAGTFDNRSTTAQLRFLLRCEAAEPAAQTRSAIERGLDYIFQAQFPNGAWPQCYPLEGAYHDAVTLNDNALGNIMELLVLAASGAGECHWLDAPRQARAAASLAAARGVLLRLQVSCGGKPTVWCAQYDPFTLQPVAARGFEPPSLSGSESVDAVLALMEIPRPPHAVVTAIEAALAWFAAHRLPPGPDGRPFWARFYDLNHQRPIFPGKRDGRWHASLEELKQFNPVGYDYLVDAPAELLGKRAAQWRKNLTNDRGP